jgi:CubicO group peptidase (beta-lactamase class C family)
MSGRAALAIALTLLWYFHPSWGVTNTYVRLPENGVSQRLSEWLMLCRAPNQSALEAWAITHLKDPAGAPGRAKNDFEFCSTHGELKVAEITRSDSDSISVLATSMLTQNWFRLSFAQDGSGRLSRLDVFLALPPESSWKGALNDAAIARQTGDRVNRLAQAGIFSGIAVVARGPRIIASATGGYANREAKKTISLSTRFTLGSLGKMFTATAIGQLVDAKKISFSDRVGKFFPDYPDRTIRDKVTVSMLLSHTSGMGDFLGKRTPSMMKNGVKRADEFMPLYENDAPHFAPGSDWDYSNAGLALAGAIVERVSGEAFPDYLRKHIFEAAGMVDSDPNNMPGRVGDLVTPYTRDATGKTTVADADVGSPAGGEISSARDLMRFADALRSGRLVTQATFSAMRHPLEKPAQNAHYGYALEIEDVYGRTVVGHSGGFPGVSTSLRMIVDSPLMVVVLENLDPPADSYIGMPLTALVAAKAGQSK